MQTRQDKNYLHQERGKVRSKHKGNLDDSPFQIVEGFNYATLSANRLSVNWDATIGARIGFIAIADGVTCSVYFIEVLPIRVVDIDWDTGLKQNVQLGRSFKLAATALPVNASFRDITFKIIEGSELGSINGNVLTINSNALVGGIVRIAAIADGITSLDVSAITIIPVTVTGVVIERDNDHRIMPNSVVNFNSRLYPFDAVASVMFAIVGDGWMYAEIDPLTGELIINGIIPRGNIQIIIQLIDKATQIREEIALAERLKGTHDMIYQRVKEIRQVIKLPYFEYRGDIFRSLVEKVIVKDKKTMRFIFKSGIEMDCQVA